MRFGSRQLMSTPVLPPKPGYRFLPARSDVAKGAFLVAVGSVRAVLGHTQARARPGHFRASHLKTRRTGGLLVGTSYWLGVGPHANSEPCNIWMTETTQPWNPGSSLAPGRSSQGGEAATPGSQGGAPCMQSSPGGGECLRFPKSSRSLSKNGTLRWPIVESRRVEIRDPMVETAQTTTYCSSMVSSIARPDTRKVLGRDKT